MLSYKIPIRMTTELLKEKVSVEILTTQWSFTPHGIILGASCKGFFFCLDPLRIYHYSSAEKQNTDYRKHP